MLGVFVGIVSVMLLATWLDPVLSTGALFTAYAIAGVIAGASQGAFLRRYARPKLLWLGASGAGWLTFFSIVEVIISIWPDVNRWQSARLEQWFAIAALGGAIIGTAQWLVLRRTFGQTVWWIPLNAGVWVAMMVGYLIIFGPFIGLACW
jgi:predicted membrane protein